MGGVPGRRRKPTTSKSNLTPEKTQTPISKPAIKSTTGRKSTGDTLTADDWNALVNRVATLEQDVKDIRSGLKNAGSD